MCMCAALQNMHAGESQLVNDTAWHAVFSAGWNLPPDLLIVLCLLTIHTVFMIIIGACLPIMRLFTKALTGSTCACV